jgi:hypothetical protein
MGADMVDVRNELRKEGLDHVGWIQAGDCNTPRCRHRHEPGHVHAYIQPDIEKCIVYAFIIGDQVVKVGKAGSKNSTLAKRMKEEASCGNDAWLFAEGRPLTDAAWQHRKLDKFKQVMPDVIRSGQKIEAWAGGFTAATFEDKERELNRRYTPAWVDREG